MIVPCSKTPEELYLYFKSSHMGVNPDQAEQYIRIYGHNTIEEEQNTFWGILFSQFTSPIVLILIAAAFLSWAMGQVNDSLMIMGILIVNALLGFYQEYRAETSIRALKKLTETHVRVVRMGLEALMSSDDIIPGDILLLGEGDLIPADIRLIEAHGL